jgi:NAD(P)H dehydrogenase (quinone)
MVNCCFAALAQTTTHRHKAAAIVGAARRSKAQSALQYLQHPPQTRSTATALAVALRGTQNRMHANTGSGTGSAQCCLTPRSSGAPTACHQAWSVGARTFSTAQAWRHAVVAHLARTLGRMNALLVVAHPSKVSFSHAMLDVAVRVLIARGYACAVHDLYEEGFNPVRPKPESGNTVSDDPLVERHCYELKEADLILVFHPNWWSQPPAILKGWVDRVFRLGTAYEYPQGTGFEDVPVGLLRAKHALVFNTSNTPETREAAVFGDPLEALWRISIFGLCGVSSVHRRMFGPVAGSTVEQRESWLSEVRAVITNAA